MCEKIQVSKMAVETNNRCVQRGSKVSELAVQNGFGVAPSMSDGPAQRVSNMSKMFEKTNNRCAQRHSKLSESDGCPVCYAGRMGYVQEHSKVSEWAVQNGFGVAPSVSDGPAQTVSPAVAGSKMFEKTDTRCAERSSKVSEWLSKMRL